MAFNGQAPSGLFRWRESLRFSLQEGRSAHRRARPGNGGSLLFSGAVPKKKVGTAFHREAK